MIDWIFNSSQCFFLSIDVYRRQLSSVWWWSSKPIGKPKNFEIPVFSVAPGGPVGVSPQ